MNAPDLAFSNRNHVSAVPIRTELCRLIVATLALAFLPSVVGAQELLRVRDQYVYESQLLDADIDNYMEARGNEQAALGQLIELNRRLDRAMADASVPSEELVKLHNAIADARDAAFSVSVDVGDRREEMGERMRRMQALLNELRQGGVEYVEANGSVGGTWLVESNEGLGLISLTQSGGQLTGLYRLSNGQQGTLNGRFARRFKVDLFDSEVGPVGTLVGELDDRSGELRGEWSSRELAQGRATGGTWSGRRLSFDDLLNLEP